MKILKEWEGLGGTIIQVTSEPSTGGAILKKDQRGWTTDGRLTGQSVLILGRGQFRCRTICGMLQEQFQRGEERIGVAGDELLAPEEGLN